MNTNGQNVTPGYGILEKILSKKRAAIANFLIPKESREGRILDIGCGTIPLFLLNTEFREKYGIDPSVRISDKQKNVYLQKYDIEEGGTLPFEDNFFDTVTMLAVFEHIEQSKLPGTMREIKRVLKPGGVFIMTTPCPWADKLLRIMARVKLVSQEGMYEHKGAYSHDDLRS
ncbi:MAG: class I SAM-dependent methyltransferase [Patescibacteria group bacterium]